MSELYPILMLFHYKAFRQQFRHLSECGGIVRDVIDNKSETCWRNMAECFRTGSSHWIGHTANNPAICRNAAELMWADSYIVLVISVTALAAAAQQAASAVME